RCRRRSTAAPLAGCCTVPFAVSRLLSYLSKVVPQDEKERRDLAAMTAFAGELDAPFSREQLPAHFTGSAVVVDPSGQRVCMVFHPKLERWLQPGGHWESADAGDIAATALREAR